MSSSSQIPDPADIAKAHRAAWSAEQRAVVDEMTSSMRGFNSVQTLQFFESARLLVEHYSVAYQLPGELVLVLDNSIVQDFKHRGSQAQSAARALAFVAFCRFVTLWSDRPSHLAVPAVAIYEHMGRQPAENDAHLHAVVDELLALLADTRMRVTALGFGQPRPLLEVLRDIHSDAQMLTALAQGIHGRSWKTDLRTSFGVKIPMSLAHEAVPDQLPLRYFHPAYVKLAFSARIEREIIQQSKHDPEAQPISSGELMELLAGLNGKRKAIVGGKLQGLGDIELLQYCDLRRQHQRPAKHVFVGQTYDHDLARVLGAFSALVYSEGWTGGTPEAASAAQRLAELLTGLRDPFKQERERAAHLRPLAGSFVRALADACLATSGARQHPPSD